MFGLTLVWNWRDAWRWASVQVAAASAAIQFAILTVPDTVRQYLPDWVTHWSAIFCFASIVVARITATRDKSNEPSRPS